MHILNMRMKQTEMGLCERFEDHIEAELADKLKLLLSCHHREFFSQVFPLDHVSLYPHAFSMSIL